MPPPPESDLSRLSIAEKGSAQRGKGNVFFALGGVVIALVSFAVGRCAGPGRGENSDQPGRPENSAELSAPVTAQAGSTSPLPLTLSATGYVVAERQAAVSSKATGRLMQLNVREGDHVKKGDILAILENTDLLAAVHEKEANVTSVRAHLTSSEVELQDAERQFQRRKQLLDEHAISKNEYESAEARAHKATAEVTSQHALLELAQAQLSQAQINLSYSSITAPFDATVLTKNAEVGEVVAPFGSSTNSRAAVVTIADMESLLVEADVSESQIARVKIGQNCTITLDSYPNHTYHGEVVKIVPTVDRAKATVLTKIRFRDRDERVLPEMSAKIVLEVSP